MIAVNCLFDTAKKQAYASLEAWFEELLNAGARYWLYSVRMTQIEKATRLFDSQ
jgi:hypothetical protein